MRKPTLTSSLHPPWHEGRKSLFRFGHHPHPRKLIQILFAAPSFLWIQSPGTCQDSRGFFGFCTYRTFAHCRLHTCATQIQANATAAFGVWRRRRLLSVTAVSSPPSSMGQTEWGINHPRKSKRENPVLTSYCQREWIFSSGGEFACANFVVVAILPFWSGNVSLSLGRSHSCRRKSCRREKLYYSPTGLRDIFMRACRRLFVTVWNPFDALQCGCRICYSMFAI